MNIQQSSLEDEMVEFYNLLFVFHRLPHLLPHLAETRWSFAFSDHKRICKICSASLLIYQESNSNVLLKFDGSGSGHHPNLHDLVYAIMHDGIFQCLYIHVPFWVLSLLDPTLGGELSSVWPLYWEVFLPRQRMELWGEVGRDSEKGSGRRWDSEARLEERVKI